MECPECGHEIEKGEARCPACRDPRIGDPRNAPAGSDPSPPPDRGGGPWSPAVWSVVATAVIVAVVLAVLSL